MSSTEFQIQEPGSLIPPGNRTGTYYIVVAGLPWNTSWQSLKDFAKRVSDGTQVNIDYAMVYPGSTDGWVRIIGLKSFRKVLGKLENSVPTLGMSFTVIHYLLSLARLDGGAFNNRNLIVDGRNETEFLNLRAMKPSKSPESSEKHATPSITSFRSSTPSYALESCPQSPCHFGPSLPPTCYYESQSGPPQVCPIEVVM
jgi:hypothetical protein